jgi:DNA-directed RNA polymerase subunit RPC12/RpoP
MATILITCPECKKQLKGPSELLGKKIRCKSCGSIFTVITGSPDKASLAGQPAKAKAAQSAPVQQAPPPRTHPEDEDSKNPYKLTDIVLGNRCPQCAAEMEEGDIICLNCGYNTRTRMRQTTIKTIETTTFEWILWLTPGILCTLVVLANIGVICYLWFVFSDLDADRNFSRMRFALKVWGSIFCAFIGWVTGKIAFKRLIINTRPPEKLKH